MLDSITFLEFDLNFTFLLRLSINNEKPNDGGDLASFLDLFELRNGIVVMRNKLHGPNC